MAEIMISNKMSTIYSVKGYSESMIDTDVTVGVYSNSDVNVEVAVRATGISDIPVLLNVVYSGLSEIQVEVQPIIFSEIEVEVEINPVNRMSVIYEVIEPSVITYEVKTLRDTFTSSNEPYNVINFGANNSIKVGQDVYGNNTGFIAFNISEVPIGKVIKNAKMRVYYTNYRDVELTLNKVNGVWSEYSLTHNNDITNITPIATSYIVNTEARYIEFDILEQFNDWYMGIANNGVAITSTDTLTLLRARESDSPPSLLVEYYSDDIYSVRTSNVLVDVVVAIKQDSEIDVVVDVVSKYQNSEILIEVLAHQVNDIITSDIEVELEVLGYESTSEIEVVVTATQPDNSYIDIEVEVPIQEADSEIEVDVTVVLYDNSIIDIEVEVPVLEYNSEILVDVDVVSSIQNDESTINIEVDVPEFTDNSIIDIEVVVVVNQNSSIDVEFEISDGIPKDGNSDLMIAVEVIEQGTYSQFDIEVSVYGEMYSDIDVDLEVIGYEDSSNIEVDVFVNIKDGLDSIDVEVAVVDYADSSIDVDVYARVLDISDVYVDVTVISGGKKNIYCYKL